MGSDTHARSGSSRSCGQPPEERSPEDLQPRPMWQRLLLPIVGLLCMLVAAISGFLPFIPGWPLALLGAPLLAAFNPRYEAWVRRKMRLAWTAIRRRFGKGRDPDAGQDDAESTREPPAGAVRRSRRGHRLPASPSD